MEEILAALKARGTQAKGLGTALDYLGFLVPCLGDDGCTLSAKATKGEWTQMIKEASNRLVYTDPAMEVLAGHHRGDKAFGAAAISAQLPKTDKACADYATVLTATTTDRDRDLLEAKGARLDTRAMPLLYMHNPLWPIGSMKSVLHRDDNKVVVHNAIADTPLGRDAALFAEFGTLSTSHGFIPQKARQKQDGGFHIEEYDIVEVSLVSVRSNPDGVITLFQRNKLESDINKAWGKALSEARPKVVQGVWDPDGANKPEPKHACDCGGDAASCSCEKVTDVEVKNSALYDTQKPLANTHSCRQADPGDFQKDSFRQVQKKHGKKKYSLVMAKRQGSESMEVQSIHYPTSDWSAAEAKKHCASHGEGTFEPAAKTVLAVTTKDMGAMARPGYGESVWMRAALDGSWESVTEALDDQAMRFLKDAGVKTPEYGGSACVCGTFDDSAVLCLIKDYDGAAQFYRASWEDKEGVATLTGTPEQVELSVSVKGAGGEDAHADHAALLAAAGAALARKAAKVSKRNLQRLAEAHTLIDAVKKAAELTPPTKASATSAHALVESVIQDAQGKGDKSVTPGDGSVTTPPETPETLARKLVKSLGEGKTLGKGTALALSLELEAIDDARRTAELVAIGE